MLIRDRYAMISTPPAGFFGAKCFSSTTHRHPVFWSSRDLRATASSDNVRWVNQRQVLTYKSVISGIVWIVLLTLISDMVWSHFYIVSHWKGAYVRFPEIWYRASYPAKTLYWWTRRECTAFQQLYELPSLGTCNDDRYYSKGVIIIYGWEGGGGGGGPGISLLDISPLASQYLHDPSQQEGPKTFVTPPPILNKIQWKSNRHNENPKL